MGIHINVIKLCHILFGNRTNFGYRYFSWNCGRGYLFKNKIEDVKQIAIRYKPHFMGISEVDLVRNEANAGNLYHEFSTDQLQEKLKIQGYKLFLPPSWLEHNTARIVVYVDEELRVNCINS